MERLQKAIAASGYTFSEEKSGNDLIRSRKKIEVNGKVVTELGTKVKQGDFNYS
mgnify:CR=1 FL=1